MKTSEDLKASRMMTWTCKVVSKLYFILVRRKETCMRLTQAETEGSAVAIIGGSDEGCVVVGGMFWIFN